MRRKQFDANELERDNRQVRGFNGIDKSGEPLIGSVPRGHFGLTAIKRIATRTTYDCARGPRV